MRQIEDARKSMRRYRFPRNCPGGSGQPLSGQRKSGRVRGKKYQWPEYTEETGYTEETRDIEETGYGGYVPVRQQPLCWYLLRR